ncbi:MAG TPA: BON domain-containing protein [Acidimicrobiales bacterium]|nr:BON domain-containing protein [Acidimicrobiales bacterium]
MTVRSRWPGRAAAHRGILALVLSLALAVGGATYPVATPAVAATSHSKSKATLPDATIQKEVLAALRKAKFRYVVFCADYHHFVAGCLKVTVKGGVVTLSGVVRSTTQWEQAGKLARRQKGVKSVVNHITTSLPGPHQTPLPVPNTTTTTAPATTTTEVINVAAAGTTVDIFGSNTCLNSSGVGNGQPCSVCNNAQYDPVPPATVDIGTYLNPVQPGVKVTLTITAVDVPRPVVLPFPAGSTSNPVTSTRTVLAGTAHYGGDVNLSLAADGGPNDASFYGLEIVASVQTPSGVASSGACDLEVDRPAPPPPSAYHLVLICPPSTQGDPVALMGSVSPLPSPGDLLEIYSIYANSGSNEIEDIATPVTPNSQGQFSATVNYPAVSAGGSFDSVTADVQYIPAAAFGEPQNPPYTVGAQSNTCTFTSQ